ncbi:toxin glutamine deamidase domain-containing protein [Streptomyces sp. NPDC001685]
MMLPDELEWVLEMLGYRWPTADEDKLRDCAEVWRKFGEKVTELHGTANGAARQVTAHNAGDSIDKFVKTYEKFDGGGGGDGYLRNAAEAAFLIANVLEACAYLVEFAKWAVIAQLIALAIEIVAAHAAAPFTFGLSEVAGLGATQITRLIVRRLLDELKQALLEAIVETMKEPAISAIEAIITDLIRQTVNVGFGAQEGYDVGATLKAGGTAGLDALKQSPQTFAEGVRDSLGQKAGSRARHAIDSRLDGYDGTSGLPSGDVGSDPGTDNSSSSSSSSDSPSSSSSNSNASGSDSSSSNGSDSSTSTRSSNGSNLPGTNIGNGISAETGGNDIGGPNLGPGPDSGSGPGSDSSSPSSSDTPYSRPTQSPTDSSLSDFDDPSPGGRSPSGSDGPTSSSGSPSAPGPSHNGGGPSVSGLSSPSPQSAPTHTSSPGASSTPSGGSIGTQVDNLAATAPTQSNAAPTSTTSDASPSGSGGRSDGGSSMPTSPTAPTATGTAPSTSHSGGPSGGSPSTTSPQPNSGPARNPSSSTPGTAPAAGTGPASTPRPTSPTVPRSTPAPAPDGRTPATGDSRTPGTPDNRIPAQRPGGTPSGDAGTTPRNAPGTPPASSSPRGNPTTAADSNTPRPRPGTPTPNDGATPRNTPGTTPNDSATSRNNAGTTPNDGTSPRNRPGTRPNDGTTSRNTAGTTTNDRGDRTPPRTDTPGNQSTTPRGDNTPRQTSDPSGNSRTSTPGQNPSQSTPSQSTPPRSTPHSSTPSTPPSTSTPGTTTPHSTPPGPATHTPTPQSSTPGTPNQPNSGTPSRPPQQPAGNTPNQPGPQTQPQPQPHTQQPSASPPNPQQQQQQPQVTPVPVHHVTTTPSGQPTPSAPHTPDSGHTATPDQNNNTSDSTKPREAPAPASQTRNNNPPGGVTDPSRAEQDALENSVPRDENGDPTRPPDPADGPWVQRINGEGPDAPGRSNNCVDTALSTVDTYAGNPTAAGARTPDLDADGNPSDRGERGGRDRIENTLGARFSDMGNGRDAFNRLENTLRDSGHGSQAVIITQDANGRAHAWNAVNHNGKITYIDAQTGQQSRNPLHSGDHGVFAIPLDSNRQPVTPKQPATTTSDSRDADRGTPRSTPEQSPDTARRPAAEPAGQPSNSQNGDGQDPKDQEKNDEKDKKAGLEPHPDDSHSRLSREFGDKKEQQGNLDPDDSQQRVRQTNPVFRLQQDHVDQQLRDWAKNGQLAHVLQVAAGTESDANASPDRPRTFTSDGLNKALPGFDKLNRGERMLVISTLARLSQSAHEQYGVNSNPLNTAAESEGAAKHKTPGERVRKLMTKLMVPEAHTPDLTQRNFAVVELQRDDGTIEYVTDSSFPSRAGVTGLHSERHLSDWINDVNEAHAGTGRSYTITALYTEREPCGDKKGGLGSSNCSNLLGERLAGAPVYYSATYRADPADQQRAELTRELQKQRRAELGLDPRAALPDEEKKKITAKVKQTFPVTVDEKNRDREMVRHVRKVEDLWKSIAPQLK